MLDPLFESIVLRFPSPKIIRAQRDVINGLIIGVVVIAIWAGSWMLTIKYIGVPSGAGTFGDQFGAVNSLFSGLALAGIIYTIILQKKELKLQRKELELTRNELKMTAEAQAKSAQLLDLQIKNEAFRRRNDVLPVLEIVEIHSSPDDGTVQFRIMFKMNPATLLDVKYEGREEMDDIEFLDRIIEVEFLKDILIRNFGLTSQNYLIIHDDCRIILRFKDIDSNEYEQVIYVKNKDINNVSGKFDITTPKWLENAD